jgi:hypothetical protein
MRKCDFLFGYLTTLNKIDQIRAASIPPVANAILSGV